jgi:hypothetical protein
VAEHTVGKDKTPSCLFYENRDGFNFREVTSFVDDQNFMQKFDQSDYVADVKSGGVYSAGDITRDVLKSYTKVLAVRVDTSFDFFKDYLDGTLTSRLYSADPVTKKIRWVNFDIVKDKVSTMNKSRLYTDDSIQTLNPVIMSMNRGYGTFGMNEPSNYSIIQKRNSSIRLFQASKIEIDVSGRTDYTVGRKVFVSFDQMREIVKEESNASILDRLNSGNFIVTAVAHHITREKHECTLELCKESSMLA